MIWLISKFFTYSVLNASLTLLLSVYIARTVSVKDYGVVGLVMAANFLLRPLASFNAVGLVAINRVKLIDERFQNFANNYFIFSTLVFFTLLAISLLFGMVYEDYLLLFLLLPILTYLMVYSDFHNAVLINDRQGHLFGMYGMLTRIVTILSAVVLLKIVEEGWFAYLLAMLVAEAAVLVLRIRVGFGNLAKFRFLPQLVEQVKILKFGLPLFAALFAGWAINQSDKFIVLKFFSLEEVAVYTVSYTIGMAINTINQAVKNAILPVVYENLKLKTNHKFLNRCTIIYGFAIGVFILLLCLTADFVIPALFGEKYRSSTAVVVMIAVAYGFNGIYRITGMVIEYYEKNALKSILLLIALLVNLVLSLSLIPAFGVVAPAIGTIACYLVLAIMSQYYGARLLNEN